jgi:polar amino acid transport system substrate-binding protein
MPLIRALIAAAAAIAGVAAQAAELPGRIRAAGKLVIATEGKFPPLNYFDPATNQLTGLDIDLGNAIGRQLGVNVEWQDAPFAQLIPSLRTGRVDVVMAGIRDTVSRRENVDFVNYLLVGAQFYTLKTSGDRFRTGLDLCGRRVGANIAATWTRWITAWSEANCAPSGRPPVVIVGAENTLAARVELKTGRVDAAITGSETMNHLHQTEPGLFAAVGEPFAQSPDGIATAKTPEGREIRDAIAAALTAVQQSGEYDRILAKYGLEAHAYKPVTINQGTEP